MTPKFDTPYGSNEAVGAYAEVNGIQMYYEVYGEGEPLFLIHGNGANIASMGHQIEYFSKNYKVIVADSRGHGKSTIGEGRLTYVQMAEDWVVLMDKLETKNVKVIGWSDGGILGLLISIYHPDKIDKLASMGANLQPNEEAVYSWAVEMVKQMKGYVDGMVAKKDTTQDWAVMQQFAGLLGEQPDISLEDLSKIKAKVLIMAGDKDIIREEHSVLIYQNIPNAHLCIFPGETHFTPVTDPELFNLMVDRFFKNPFKRPDSKDFMN
jgi:pimeloyl-ACP methyl ester carboxylesterase